MASKLGEEIVDEATRDKVFASIRHEGDNNICLDCDKKNTKWASIHLGVHLCYDCAGKHRQFGVQYSFIKSTNLDSWNKKQLLFMQKGTNARAHQYFRKCGIVTQQNRHIDYKSPVAQKYKQMLTLEVETELAGPQAVKPDRPVMKPTNDFFVEAPPTPQAPIFIAEAETVQVKEGPAKKKKKKNIGAKQINLDDFQNIAFDDGVSKEEKEKIVKDYEKQKITPQESDSVPVELQKPVKLIEPPQEMTKEEAEKRMQELKQKKNIKSLSSEEFKDTSIDNVTLKQNLNRFSNSQSISSSAFFNEQEEKSNETVDKIKGLVADAGEKLLSKITSYWGSK